ncbi:MAG: hypothetical protein WC911_02010 [Thermoleophilia bacterium]
MSFPSQPQLPAGSIVPTLPVVPVALPAPSLPTITPSGTFVWGNCETYVEETLTLTCAAGVSPGSCLLTFTGDADAFEMVERDGVIIDPPQDCSTISDQQSRFSVAPGGSTTAKFRFIPTDGAAKSATLTVTNELGASLGTFTMSGTWTDTFVIANISAGMSLYCARDISVGALSLGTRFRDMSGVLPDHIAIVPAGEWAIKSDAPIGACASLAKCVESDTQTDWVAGATRRQITIESNLSTGAIAGFVVFKVPSYYYYVTLWMNKGNCLVEGGLNPSFGIYTSATQIALYVNDGGGFAQVNHASTAGVLFAAWRRSGGTTYHYLSAVGGAWKGLGSASSATFQVVKGSMIYPDCTPTRVDNLMYAWGISEFDTSEADLQAIFEAM